MLGSFNMGTLGAVLKVCASISRFKARQESKYYSASILEDDPCDVIFLSHLKLALDNLGGNLTKDEIDTLIKGIEEDVNKGITYDDFISVLIFASFFISAFDRRGEGSVTGNDVHLMILNTIKKEDLDPNSDRERKSKQEDNNGSDVGLDIDLNYQNFIELIETTRLGLGSTNKHRRGI